MASPGKNHEQKAWVKPELIVLVRGRPEEGVLGVCKRLGEATNPVGQNNDCMNTFESGCINSCVDLFHS